jgi:hypothetical protein
VDCKGVKFSSYAIRRMFERGIKKDGVVKTVLTGEVIVEYPEDRPYPSFLMLGWVGDEPLHVLVAIESESRLCIVVTVYSPDPDLWEDGFRKRREL